MAHWNTRGRKSAAPKVRLNEAFAVVPDDEYVIPLGNGDIKRPGKDVTVIATAMMVHRALEAAEKLEAGGIDVEVIDPRSLTPLDRELAIDSVRKTARAVIVSEDSLTCGVAAEIATIIMEDAFDYLDAPVKRIAAIDAPMPFAPIAEDYAIPSVRRILDGIVEVAGGGCS